MHIYDNKYVLMTILITDVLYENKPRLKQHNSSQLGGLLVCILKHNPRLLPYSICIIFTITIVECIMSGKGMAIWEDD